MAELRLRLYDYRQRHPEVAEQQIAAPLAVIGLPRTGTTMLVDLLAQDPDVRAALQWETQNLLPPADKATWASDPRIAQLEAQFQAQAATNPIVALGQHTFGATLPDECNAFLSLNFWSPNLVVGALLPEYNEWLSYSRPERPYLTHRWVLQHLQAHGPGGRWVLKSPFHAFAPAALAAEYPGLMLVQPHRDPMEQIASIAGLVSTIRGFGPGHPGRAATAREQAGLWAAGLQRCLSDRNDPVLNSHVLDLSHHELVRDPVGTMRKVYARFDLDFTPQAEARARAWVANPAQHKSKVRFTLADFDFTEDDVDAIFGAYRQRFADYF
jgi:hypothetical protein